MGEYKNLNNVKVFWKYLLNGDEYYFTWDEIIFSKQAENKILKWLLFEERACRKLDLGSGDYYLKNSGLPPSSGLSTRLS